METSATNKGEDDPHASHDGDGKDFKKNLESNRSKSKMSNGDDKTKKDLLSDTSDEKQSGTNAHDRDVEAIMVGGKADGNQTKTSKLDNEQEGEETDEETSDDEGKEQNNVMMKPDENSASPRSVSNPSNPQPIAETDDKPSTGTENGLSQPPTKSSFIITTASSQPIRVDLRISRVMDIPQGRDGNTGGDRWTEGVGNHSNGRQGGGVCKSVDFSVPVGMDDVDAELARVVSAMTEDQLLFDPHEYGRGATTNTPVTVMTDYAESFSQIQGRGLHTPSREHIYQHALSIMKKRCRSSRTVTSNARSSCRPKMPDSVIEENGTAFPNFSLPAVVANMDRYPLVQNPNCIFYVTQSRQHPIAPVKAWKGYEGNLYFQPVVCKKVGLTPSSTPRENALNKATRRAYSTPITMSKSAESQTTQLPQLPQSECAARDGQPNTAPSVVGTRSVRSQCSTAPSRHKSFSFTASTAKSRASTARQLAVLDKRSVFRKMDSNIREDIQWISGLEAMGTLHIGGLKLPRSTAHFYENTGRHHKLKIQRGLVSHQLAASDHSLPTLLGVHGGRLNDSADSVAKTKHMQLQYQPCKPSHSSNDDGHVYSPNLFSSYSGPFTSIEQLRRDSSSSPRLANSSPSSDMMLKDDSLHSLASVYKNTGNTVPLYSSKEVLFRNREALFLTRPNYR